MKYQTSHWTLDHHRIPPIAGFPSHTSQDLLESLEGDLHTCQVPPFLLHLMTLEEDYNES